MCTTELNAKTETEWFTVVYGDGTGKQRRFVKYKKTDAEAFVQQLKQHPYVTYAYVEECDA